MPKHKSKKDESSGSDSDSGPEDRTPVKKSKSDTKTKQESSNSKSNEDDMTWSLGKNRSARLTEFKGKWFLDIREFYNSDGDMKPGRKGIMLTMEQWQKFKSHLDSIDDAIKKHV